MSPRSSDGSARNIQKLVSYTCGFKLVYIANIAYCAVLPVVEEEEVSVTGEDGQKVAIPIEYNGTNPNGTEFDNLYLDMNGIVSLVIF